MSVTLVLLHAFPLTSAIYARQREALADVADVRTPDFRGFGEAALGDDPPSLDRLADDVVRLLDRLGVERAVVGGTSMGGYVTLALLRLHPERVGAALLANTKASSDPPEARENRLRVADTVADLGVPAALAAMTPKLVGTTTRSERPDLVSSVEGLVAGAAPAAVAWAQRAMADRGDSFAALAAFPRPVLVLAGEEDELMPRSEAEAMAAAAPGARLELIPGAGHLGCLEAPLRWNALVRSWLEGL